MALCLLAVHRFALLLLSVLGHLSTLTSSMAAFRGLGRLLLGKLEEELQVLGELLGARGQRLPLRGQPLQQRGAAHGLEVQLRVAAHELQDLAGLVPLLPGLLHELLQLLLPSLVLRALELPRRGGLPDACLRGCQVLLRAQALRLSVLRLHPLLGVPADELLLQAAQELREARVPGERVLFETCKKLILPAPVGHSPRHGAGRMGAWVVRRL
mmetsp:Transcript_36141/g.103955  ORF Transcript_36141/g.103955 Transcript_36141/m.103955 type:complete len:213 (-) Transcript_36141:9-647(-)